MKKGNDPADSIRIPVIKRTPSNFKAPHHLTQIGGKPDQPFGSPVDRGIAFGETRGRPGR